MKHPEILAPAGSFDSLIAAVQCGANAVYLGGKGMNARRNAGNFDAEELRRAVEYCHLRGVKVYQTINIVMFEDEIDEAVETIRTAAEAGVDAVLTPGERAQHNLRPLRRAGLSEHLAVQLHERVGGEDHGGGIV